MVQSAESKQRSPSGKEGNGKAGIMSGAAGIINRQSAIGDRQSRASALIVVLWVIGLLSLLVSSFAFDAHIEARITSYYRKRTKAEYLARSGMEIAEMLMAKSAGIKGDSESEEDDRWYEHAKHLKEGGAISLEEKLGDGTVTVDIVPEPARRNINKLGNNDNEKEENLERILEVGGVPEDMWPELIESFLDWTDKDDVARVDGAETEDYYATLEPSYQAKNGPLDTVEELLLVKGFNRTILSGGALETEYEDQDPVRITGIKDVLTTYGSGKVNVNVAEPNVLMTLPEVDELVAGAIVEEREGLSTEDGEGEWAPFKSSADFCSRMGLTESLKKYITTSQEAYYRITSVGEVHRVKRKVWCIVKYAGKKITILRWREEE